MFKKGVCFLMMSLLVMAGYLVAIAGSPSPGWITRGVDGIDGAQIGTLYFNTYVSYNYRDDAGTNPNFNEYYTYHWAQVTGATDTKFKIEFKHSAAVADPADAIKRVDRDGDENPTSGIFELDLVHTTNDVPHNSTYSPYTALRPIPVNEGGGGGTGEVKSELINVNVP